jgi:N-acetylglucosamine malate deacetylase 1
VNRTILVVAPHADDEVLGVGGTIAKLRAQGDVVHVAIVTAGHPPDFTDAQHVVARAEANAAHALLGVANTVFLDLPAAALDTLLHRELNRCLDAVLLDVRPHVVFVPFPGDLHRDHQLVFESTMVAVRPNGGHVPAEVYAYETLSETNWNAPYLSAGFTPNVFVDITEHLEAKIAAIRAYATQLEPFPHERSEPAIRALATLRGATSGCAAAEAFVMIRSFQ